jgi:CBS domain-containing protein
MLIAQVIGDKGAVVHTLAANATLEDAARELNEKRVGALVVIDAEGAIIGVFSERDLVREISRRGAEALQNDVFSAMSREVVTAHPEETIDHCLGRMTDRRVRHLPVVVGGPPHRDRVDRRPGEAPDCAAPKLKVLQCRRISPRNSSDFHLEFRGLTPI